MTPSSTRISAGKLPHNITILQPTEAQDGSGNINPGAQEPVATVWAGIEALTGRELYNAQQKVSQVTHRITIRYMPGLKAMMNVQFMDPGTGLPRQFQIQAIENPDEKMHKLGLLCIERDDSAREP